VIEWNNLRKILQRFKFLIMPKKMFKLFRQHSNLIEKVVCMHVGPPKESITLPEGDHFGQALKPEIKKPQTAIWGKETHSNMSDHTISRFYCNGIFFVHQLLGLLTMKKESQDVYRTRHSQPRKSLCSIK